MRAYAYDFDGTLTTRDTLIDFARHSRGCWRLLAVLLVLSPRLVLMKLGLCDNGRTKERFFGLLFGGMDYGCFSMLCADYAAKAAGGIFRRDMLRELQLRLDEGAPVYVVSASMAAWVTPLLGRGLRRGSRQPVVIGTEPEIVGDKLTGRFRTPNCYGAEKVERLREEMGGLCGVTLVAYGDSAGDRELLAMADEPFLNGKPATDEAIAALQGKMGEALRFVAVGGVATVLQYVFYLAMLRLLDGTAHLGDGTMASLSNAVAYALSFVFNFVASTRYTFRVKANARRGAGFAFSHMVNFALQTVSLNTFIWLGMDKQWAMVPMFCVCVPVNFFLVRFSMKGGAKG